MGEIINVTSPSMPPYEEFVEEIKDIWDRKWLTNNGPKHQKLESEIEKFLNVDSACLVTNGHMALEIALQAMGLNEGEVITTPFTFASTTLSILRCGLTPVFCDIDKDTLCIDTTKIEELITDKTVAIVPVHVYGTPCNVDEIERIAKKHNLKVLYDAAHAFGVKIKGKSIACYGDMSTFSFHATKVYNTVEGGCIVCKPEEKDSIYKIKSFGMNKDEDASFIGTNAKMSEIHAAMGICNLRHTDEEKAKRRAAYERYDSHLQNQKGLKVLKPDNTVDRNYAYYPVVFTEEFSKTREQVIEELANENIHARKYFYPLTSELTAVKEKCGIQNTPVAEYTAKRVICLPLYSDLKADDIDRICKIILS
ncbi:MAG: DegT/DnrJ/EryC1/StrS family aminotransferase [Acetobacter sp.]|nr:DegT/DnrJ/EryC1/StrS family aminotransferase [Bacteroides sp.]MCM1341247.1 DegT/DnrJ/EryC1/StrS family aminotransferase [Acetobacter sp.]MCM1433890.1 DegT/DnrJ/EryC1/StrS family aminotransferase [Clostridiales bacterium]